MIAFTSIENLSDEALIQKCRKGNQRAQKVLYNRFSPLLYRVCYRYLRNEMDTEEVLVNGFMKIYTNLGKFEYRGGKSLEGWMRRIMVNESLMYLRKSNNFKLVAEDKAENREEQVQPDSNLRAEDIFALVLQLPTGYRTVFNLYAIEGYSHKEIAEQLGISENTSKSQLCKGRAMLKKLLLKNGVTDAR